MFKKKKAMQRDIEELKQQVKQLTEVVNEMYDKTHPQVMGRRSN